MKQLLRNSLWAVTLLTTCAFSPSAEAYSGRTNADGCHNNRSNGTYHCHDNGPQSSEPTATPGVTGAEEWQVVSDGDGDTIRVSQDDKITTVRLACIDAPEMSQPTGELAKQQLQVLLPINRVVSLRPINTDRYGRLVAEVF